MMSLRVAAGLLAAVIYILLATPLLVLGRYLRVPLTAYASVGLHKLLCALLGVKVRRLGAPRSGVRLLVVNHVSWLDILVLGAMEPIAFLAKKEIGANRWTHWLVDLQGAVYVDRSKRRCIPAVNAEISRQLVGGVSLVLFAEGTTNDGVRLLPLRSSHFEAVREARTFLQPIYIDYRTIGGLKATRRDLTTIAWYGDMLFQPSLCKILACSGVSCDVHYGEIIAHDDAPDRKSLARLTETALRSLRANSKQIDGRGETLRKVNNDAIHDHPRLRLWPDVLSRTSKPQNSKA